MSEQMQKNDLYPKSYGAWAGNPKGVAPDFDRCCEEVWSRERFARFHQCQKPRGHGPDEAYCKTHDPQKVAARRAVRDAKDKASWNKRRYEWNGKRFYDALKQIADGHNDPRALAKDVIDTFDQGAY